MRRYYFRIYQFGDPDGSNIWVDAMTEKEAREKIMREYHHVDDLLLMKVEKL